MGRKRVEAPQIGARYGKLTVIENELKCGKDKRLSCLCKCDCGNETVVSYDHLRSGHTKSCGCIARSANGLCQSRLYNIWDGIKDRCCKEWCKYYPRYGGRGITLCDEWKDNFLAFYDWAISNGYDDSLTLDRIDNNKGYYPENCRWATKREQANNRRSNIYYTYNGKTLTPAMWAREIGIDPMTIYDRLRLGWDIERAVTTPLRKNAKLYKEAIT